jgi:hypothetical protein
LKLLAAAAHFGNTVQTQQLAQLAWRFVLQSLYGLDAAKRHVGQKDHYLNRGVIAAKRGETLGQVLE